MKKRNIDSLKMMILYVMIPVVFVVLILGSVNYMYSKNLQRTIIRQKETTLTYKADMINQFARNAVTSSQLFVLSEELMSVMYMVESGKKLEASEYYSIIRSFQQYKTTSDMVAGITLVDRYNMKAISENGVSSFDDYFGNSYKYEQYPLYFWESVAVPKYRYQVLSMTYKQSVNKMVIPIIFNGIMNTSPRSLVIIDLDCEVLQDKLLNSGDELMGDTYLFDVETNNESGNPEKDFMANVFLEEDFTEQLRKKTSFAYKWNGEEYLVVSSNEAGLMFDKILFVSITPMEHIMKDFNRIKIVAFLGYLMSMLLLIFLLEYMTTRFYRPLRGMMSRIDLKNDRAGKSKLYELDYLKENIDEMLQQNASYKNQLSSVMPLACERYFEKFLKSGDSTMVDEFEEFLIKSDINFKHKYFAIASVKFRFTEKFYQTFSSVEHTNVKDGVLELFSSAVGTENMLYILPSDNENYLLIVNLPDDSEEFNQLVERINRVVASFDNDIEFIRIEVSFGNPYENYSGMHKSYEECVNGSYKISSKSSVWVSSSEVKGYQYNINDENKLFNMMIKGDENGVSKLIEEIVNTAVESGVGYQELRNIYLQIYNTVQQVVASKNITDKILMGEEYVNVYESAELMSNDTLFSYIRLLVKEASLYNNAPNSKLNLEEITSYINENYAEDIYLGLLAEKYGTSERYLSRILKNYLGVSYVEYLGRVRIEHARELLEKTDLPVNDIIFKCGFNSRNTFIRTFKKYVGIVPSEYRNIYRNENGKS